MALINDFPLPLGLPPARVYVMVTQAAFQRLDEVVDVHTATFASSETRRAFSEARAKFQVLEAQGRMLKAQYDALQGDPGKNGEAELVRAIKLHQIAFEAAAEEFRKIVPLVEQQPRRVPKDKVGSVLTDGAPDLAKIYAWLKTLPEFRHAADA
ncbi:MAG TPA: hypothetical protein VJ798_02050 [Rhizomicrobium sp.]|nr:hypothetical protein [Rhizomicrobium sp.]